MKSKALLLGLMAASMFDNNHDGQSYAIDRESEHDKKVRLANEEIERKKSKGLKEFIIEGVSIWAINQKNADKKARKLNLKPCQHTQQNGIE